MHSSHIPLEIKSQSAVRNGSYNHCPDPAEEGRETIPIRGAGQHTAHPVGHRDVVGGGMRKGLGGQPATQCQIGTTGSQRPEDQVVLVGSGDSARAISYRFIRTLTTSLKGMRSTCIRFYATPLR